MMRNDSLSIRTIAVKLMILPLWKKKEFDFDSNNTRGGYNNNSCSRFNEGKLRAYASTTLPLSLVNICRSCGLDNNRPINMQMDLLYCCLTKNPLRHDRVKAQV